MYLHVGDVKKVSVEFLFGLILIKINCSAFFVFVCEIDVINADVTMLQVRVNFHLNQL